jgi:hypothetical protein
MITHTVTVMSISTITNGGSVSPARRRTLALLAVLAAQFMLVLDATVVNVALPAIQADLHLPGARLTWVNNSYLIAFGGLLLLFGRLGRLVYKVVYTSYHWLPPYNPRDGNEKERTA